VAAYEVVANPERARLHKHCGDWSAPALQVGVDDSADCVPVRICLQLEDVSGQHNRRQQVVQALPGLGAQVDAFVLSPVVAGHDALRRKLLVNTVGIGSFLIHLVDGDE